MRSSKLLRDVKALYPVSAFPIPARTHPRCLSSLRGSEVSLGPSTSQIRRPPPAGLGTASVIFSGLGLTWYLYGNQDENSETSLLPQLNASTKEKECDNGVEKKIPIRERRYKDFASIRFKGEPYMTPRDFLESVTLDKPRQLDPQFMNEMEVQKLLKSTVPRSKGSKESFRKMWNEGILTYADYLFLLTALVKTTRQFEIAFKMINADGNDYLDLKEFSKVQEAVTKQRDNVVLQQHLNQSSLTIHLFGQKGNQRLYSKDFYKFIENLQTEVLDIEFNKYACGTPTISEEDFARVLLRHTTWDLEPVFKRLKRKPKPKIGISFAQFCDFCKLLNLLDDFEIAMAMFTIAGTSVTEEEFGRAAKICLGNPLDVFVVHCIFNIFDVDGDGKLSYKEFLSVMKSWKLRGFKMREHKHISGWSEFKTCVKMEMKDR